MQHLCRSDCSHAIFCIVSVPDFIQSMNLILIPCSIGAGGAPLASVEVYDPSTDAWATSAQLPYNRSAAACAALGSSLVVAGGVSPNPKPQVQD